MATTRHIQVPILDIGCGGGNARQLKRALRAVNGVVDANVNPVTETADLELAPGMRVDPWAVVRAVDEAGFRPGRPRER